MVSKKIDELEAENSYLRQEIRGLQKKIDKLVPLFKVDVSSEDDCNISVIIKAHDKNFHYHDFLKMWLDADYEYEVVRIYNEIISIFGEYYE